MSYDKLRSLGWKPFFQQQIRSDLSDHQVARVSAHHGGRVLLLGTEGEIGVPVQLAEASGEVAVGDWLVLSEENRAIQRLERQTMLSRKAPGTESKRQAMAANVDTIFIVCSCNQDFNLSRIERYLALVLQSGATPVVVLTKADLCESVTEKRRQAERLHQGLLVEVLDARDGMQVAALESWCRVGQTVALLGSSGVGKSTLANTLGTGDLTTGGIREKDGKGRHTTTTRSLHRLPGGGVLVDTPGMREIQLVECEEGVTDLFEDVLRIAAGCRFSDCRHEADAGCAVRAAVESGQLDERRFRSYKKLLAEQAHNARTLAERRQRDRGFGRMCKSVIHAKQHQRREPG